MKRYLIPVLGCFCLILLLVGYRETSETGRPVYCAEETDLAGNRTVTEPSDVEALSADEEEKEKNDPDTEIDTGVVPQEETYVREDETETSVPETESLSEPSSRPSGNTEEPVLPADSEETESLDERNKGVFGSIQKFYHPLDVPPKDTVQYTESKREEITDTRYVESVIDENDPSTYEVVEKEQNVPSMYVNQAGDIKYAYENGVWYEYKYSSGNVSFTIRNDQLAKMLLEPRGTYDRLELMEMDCKETTDESGQIQYQYYIRYCGICAMDQAPEKTDHLAAVDLGIVAATMQVRTQEKVPVLREVTVGTGEYRYYGWQELDGKTYYFDESGEKVTGQQVIQGICHEFDEDGVKISRAGVEVSEETGAVDWEKVAEAKLDLALVQCAYRDSASGQLILDAQAENNLTGAAQAGLETGISLFSQAVTMEEAVEEAEFLINTAEKYGVKGPVVLTVCYANPEHNGRADQLEREERTKYIAACCQLIQEAGYTSMLHTDEAFLTEKLDAKKLSNCQLWLTGYDSDLTYTGSCAIWQYTDRGTVDGISGYAGLNISYGQ